MEGWGVVTEQIGKFSRVNLDPPNGRLQDVTWTPYTHVQIWPMTCSRIVVTFEPELYMVKTMMVKASVCNSISVSTSVTINVPSQTPCFGGIRCDDWVWDSMWSWQPQGIFDFARPLSRSQYLSSSNSSVQCQLFYLLLRFWCHYFWNSVH